MKRPRNPNSNARASMVDLIATALEGVQRHAAAAAKFTPEKPASSDSQGSDFLYDFARMHVQYINQLARLGSNYSIVAARALERFYDYCVPQEEEGPPLPIELEAKANERVVVRIPVENTFDEDADFELACASFRVEPKDRAFELDPQFQHPKRKRGRKLLITVKANATQEARVAFTISKDMVKGASYLGKIVVTRRRKDEASDPETRREFARRVSREFPIILRRTTS